jgi:serine/threonine protein kinase
MELDDSYLTSEMNLILAIGGNGSLADSRPDLKKHDLCPFHNANRTAEIISVIAPVMLSVHEQDIVHRDVTPNNIVLEWD